MKRVFVAIQNHVFERMNAHGRIVVCGMIADYGSAEPAPGPNWIPLIKKRITIRGFAMPDHYGEVPSLLEKLTPYVMDGKIKFRTHLLEGLESAIDGLNLFFTGGNRGKLIVTVTPLDDWRGIRGRYRYTFWNRDGQALGKIIRPTREIAIGRKIRPVMRSREIGSFCLPMLITEFLRKGISSRQSNQAMLSSSSVSKPLSNALVAPKIV